MSAQPSLRSYRADFGFALLLLELIARSDGEPLIT
jgi:hypothetical protein